MLSVLCGEGGSKTKNAIEYHRVSKRQFTHLSPDILVLKNTIDYHIKPTFSGFFSGSLYLVQNYQISPFLLPSTCLLF